MAASAVSVGAVPHSGGLDRRLPNELVMPRELIANMLGERRERVAEAPEKLGQIVAPRWTCGTSLSIVVQAAFRSQVARGSGF